MDIYSFGMCFFEMATSLQWKYCSVAKIYRMPQDGNNVIDPELKAFIALCIGQPRATIPSVSDLHDPFLVNTSGEESDNNI